jgi:hypothetical protein
MKKWSVIIVFFLIVPSVFSQSSFTVNMGNSITKFYYKNSDKESDPKTRFVDHFSYGLDYNFMGQNKFRHSCLSAEIAYQQFGANSSLYNQNLNWKLSYININVFLGLTTNEYNVTPHQGPSNWKYRFYGGISFYYSKLLNGQQTIGANSYDLIQRNKIKTYDWGIIGRIGFYWLYSDYFPIFFEIRPICGLANLELDPKQKLHNMGLSINIGLGISHKSDKSNELGPTYKKNNHRYRSRNGHVF